MRRRAVIVHRRTELDELLDRHATRGQAEFFLRTRGRTLDDVQQRHDITTETIATILSAIPTDWAVAHVERADLSRFLFAPEDIVLVIGQDGLVANTAKYLTNQLVIGVDAAPGVNAGVLVRHSTADTVTSIARIAENQHGTHATELIAHNPLTMVEGTLDDGQTLRALNELYVGHERHQSARYSVRTGQASERQASSGIIVGTGTGATGWLASISRDRGGRHLPTQSDAALAWFVREAWPSPATQATLTEGVISRGVHLDITVESDQLVTFGDGIETDRLTLTWGQTLRIGVAEQRLLLASPTSATSPSLTPRS